MTLAELVLTGLTGGVGGAFFREVAAWRARKEGRDDSWTALRRTKAEELMAELGSVVAVAEERQIWAAKNLVGRAGVFDARVDLSKVMALIDLYFEECWSCKAAYEKADGADRGADKAALQEATDNEDAEMLKTLHMKVCFRSTAQILRLRDCVHRALRDALKRG